MLWLLPAVIYAQNSSGIQFTGETEWSAVLKKAKTEHKTIFVDIYATWCIPCKEMDKKIYTDITVGDIINKEFISIKMQMDSNKNDNEYIKAWHKNSSNFKQYIDAFPTLLFFSSNGDLIGRETGYKEKEEFIKIAKEVTDSVYGYSAKLKAYNNGKLNPSGIAKLAIKANQNKNNSLAMSIAQSYKTNYLSTVNPKEILAPDFLTFFGIFNSLFSLSDSLILYIYKNPQIVDKQLNLSGFSSNCISFLIQRDMFQSIIDSNRTIVNNNPDWDKLENNISEKLDRKTAKKAILTEKIYYYALKKDWNRKAKFEFEQIDFNGINGLDEENLATINDVLFNEVFNHDVNKAVLAKAIKYLSILLQFRPDNYHFRDTYANLLYKSGNRQMAIKEQKQTILLVAKGKHEVESYTKTLKKMQNGEPTWITTNGN